VDSTVIATTPSNVATEIRNPNILSEDSEIGNTSNIVEPLVFNQRRVDFRKVNCFELNFQAFETKSTSHNQSVLRSSQNAVRIQAHRATLKIVSAILDCGKSDGQRALALHRALIHPRIREIAKSAGFQNEKMKELSYHSEQIKEFISLASHTRNKQGKPKKEESEVINTIVAALSANVTVRIDGNIMKEQKAPSGRSTSRLYGFSPYHAKKGMLNRQKIVIAKASGPNSRWWNILKRQHKGRRNIPSAIRDAVIDWVVNHENVIPSPLLNETILVKAPGSTQKRRVTKLLLEIPVRELHNKMLSELAETRDTAGKALVSDTSLRRIIKQNIPNLRRISLRHKEMCCCTICQTVFTLQRSLNAFRRRQLNYLLREINNQTEDSAERDEAKGQYDSYKGTVLPNNEPLHERPRHALKDIMCLPSPEIGHHHWACVMRKCENCPTYKLHDVESQDAHDSPSIRFHKYVKGTKCTIHGILAVKSRVCELCETFPEGQKRGKIRSRNYLTLLNRPIGSFMTEYYLPALEEYAYHLPHVRILGSKVCGKMRNEWFRQLAYCIRTIRDFAEALRMEFHKEIQSEHFGECLSLHIEGSSARFISLASRAAFNRGEISAEELDVVMETHSHFSDCSRQDSRTVFQNMKTLIEVLFKEEKLQKNSFVLDHTDGCAKQYRSATAMYLLSVLAVAYQITIDRAIGAPGHGKDEVDGLNATDKRFLKVKMAQIQAPEDDQRESRMSAAAMVEGSLSSIAEESARLCSVQSRSEGVKSENKYKKREAASVMKRRRYHVLKEEDIEFADLEMSFVTWTKEKYSSIGAMYNLRADPELGVGRIALRKIPCACDECQAQAKIPWEPSVGQANNQPRYKENKECALWSIFEGLNNWVIVDCSKPTNARKEDPDHEILIKESHRVILEKEAARTSEKIIIGNIGAISTDDPAADGYYLVEWSGHPYQTELVATSLQDTNPPTIVPKGEWLCVAQYLNKVPRAKGWYTQSTVCVTVRLQQVIASNLHLQPLSSTNKLPNTCNKTVAQRKAAKKLSGHLHDVLLSEIARRDMMDHFEDTDDVEVASDEEEEFDVTENEDSDNSDNSE
jgi:hypothetical protein